MRALVLSALALLALGCATSVRPVAPGDLVGDGPSATRVTVRVKEPMEIHSASTVYVLPVGEYRPVHADDHGVYFASPAGVLHRSGGAQETLVGGLHLPNAGGRYYSFPSMYIEDSPGKTRKLPLPDENLTAYGKSVVFTLDGVEQLPDGH